MSRRARLAPLAVVLGCVAALLPNGAATAAGPVRITKIHYAQVGTNLNSEYVIVKNTSGSRVNLKGWEMISAPSTDNQHYFFPKTRLPAGGKVVLYTGSGVNAPGRRYWGSTTPRWDNAGDKAILLNATGGTADVCQYVGGGTTAYC